MDIKSENKRLALLYDEDKEISKVIRQAEALRSKGYMVTVAKAKKKLGKQIGQLEASGFGYLWVYGRDTEEKKLGKD
jgi:histidyl-tRNA synthetase